MWCCDKNWLYIAMYILDFSAQVAWFCWTNRSVSANIDDDDYFELMMRNSWHISGGEGWCENTTCRRVLVTHDDGTQVTSTKLDVRIPSSSNKRNVEMLKEIFITRYNS